MTLTEFALAQLDREIPATRRALGRNEAPVPSIYGPTADEGWAAPS